MSMPRRTVFVLAAALATATVFNAAPPAEAGRRGDALAGAAKTFRKGFKSDAKIAEATFARVAANLAKGVAAGTTSSESAVKDFGTALAFFASSLHEAAADAAEGFAGEAVTAMSVGGDPSLPGAAAGDGGSLDVFAESIRADLAKFRAKTRKRAAKFQKALAKAGGQRRGLRVTFEDWTFTMRPAPDVGGAAKLIPEPVRLWGALATRLNDGRIIVTAFGSAAPEIDDRFDVRLARGFDVRALGDFLRSGGMDVDATGWWSFTDVINDPFGGDTVVAGNAQIHFGVDHDERGEPQRLVHGGIISIP